MFPIEEFKKLRTPFYYYDMDLLRKTVDLTPAGIIRKLDLRRPIYAPTAAMGHFGVEDRPWEQTDIAEELKKLAAI